MVSPWRASLAVMFMFAIAGGVVAIAVDWPASAQGGQNLVGNAGFEAGLTGWDRSNKYSIITLDAQSHRGGQAARLATRASERAVLSSKTLPFPHTQARRFVASAWVRTSSPSTQVRLRLKELDGQRLVDRDSRSLRLADDAWHRVAFRGSVSGSASAFRLKVIAPHLKPGQSLHVDDLVLTLQSPSALSPPPVGGGGSGRTLLGVAPWPKGAESQAQTIARVDATYGPSSVLRIFNPGLPSSWSGPAGTDGRPLVVSFKADPTAVNAGSYDANLRSWFASAPTDRPVWWNYFPEPEDNISNGEFTAKSYRLAFTRIASLADSFSKGDLRATLILMDWSANPDSGRDWRDYYPGSSVIDVLAWDAYNVSAGPWTTDRAKMGYLDPSHIYGPAIALSRAEGKPFGFAEWGSTLVPGDDGTRRAAWIRASVEYMVKAGAQFSTYFDTPVAGEFRLLDAPSVRAFRESLVASG